MIGINHIIVILFGILGLVIGGVLIDLSHKGTLENKIKGLTQKTTNLEWGFFHKPIVMLSMASFSICLGLGLLIHLFMDTFNFI
jgi:hypothetical protein